MTPGTARDDLSSFLGVHKVAHVLRGLVGEEAELGHLDSSTALRSYLAGASDALELVASLDSRAKVLQEEP